MGLLGTLESALRRVIEVSPSLRDDDVQPLDLVRQIAYREGIGDTLADGARAIIARWPAMAGIILHVKGLEQSAYDSRAAMSMALSYATSDIGAHHTRAWTIARELELGKDWSDEDKVDLVMYHQALRPLFDMLGVCRLPWIELGLNERHYEVFYQRVTGHEATFEELLALSDRIYTLTRLINTKLGMRRADDSLPSKVVTCPVRTGPLAGKAIDPAEFDRLLTIYYERRGWSEDGTPAPELEETFG